MGATRSKPLTEEETRAYSQFLEKFKDVHSYLSDREIEQNAILIWDTMTPEQKSQFLYNKKPSRACGKQEHLPGQSTNEPISETMPKKVKPKLTTKPIVKIITAKSKNLALPNKTFTTLNINTRGKPWQSLKSSIIGFPNFIQEFRRRNIALDTQTTLKLATRTWCLLHRKKKDILKKCQENGRLNE